MGLKRYFKLISKVKQNIKTDYLKYTKSPIEEKTVLLEGGQGSNINGNMFAMLREIETNPRWSSYKSVFVVTENTREKAAERMAFYNFKNVVLVNRDSKEYCRYLATAKFIATDNSFPPYFNKRDEQVFLNTWHGTPLKTLGKSDKSNYASLANIQKNYLMSDYALFPNEFTKDVFMYDYDLKNIFKGYSFIANYPRNYVFYDKEQAASMKEKLGLADKKVFGYMPTWRGTGRKANTKIQIQMTEKILKEFDEKLDDSSVLLVNLHFLLASDIDCSGYKHIKYFPGEYDTYEVLNACDGLITDYSSVFFDFAITGKKIILYAYDKEEYLSSRGLYMPFEDLPFPILENIDDVIKEMSAPVETDEAFLNKFCTNGSIKSCEDIFEMMVEGKTDVYDLVREENAGENVCLIYAGELKPVFFEPIKNYIAENPGYKYVIAYRKNLNKFSKEFILSLGSSISTYGTVTAFLLSYKEWFLSYFYRLIGKIDFSDKTKETFRREAGHLFYKITPEKIVDFSGGNTFIAGVLSQMTGEKEYIIHGDYFVRTARVEKRIAYSNLLEKSNGFKEVNYSEQENKFYLENDDNEFAHSSFSKLTRFKNILPLYMGSSKSLKCFSFFSLKTPVPVALKDCWITIGQENAEFKFYCNKNKASTKHCGFVKFSIPTKTVLTLPANNPVKICYKNKYDKTVTKAMIYFSFLRHYCVGLCGGTYYDDDTAAVATFRQMKKNYLSIYVRSFNKSDKFFEKIKVAVAFAISLVWRTKFTKKLVLLYEKNSSKYEESASVLFEELRKSGYKNAYFILDRNYEFIDKVPQEYKKYIIYKHTFKHYLYFFAAKTFIGTEALVHAFDLKTFNPFALKKISSKLLNYVFLQHGVMYMVSLDSESRKMFKRKALLGKYRVIVSSKAEADHFTTLGRHYPEDIYITGLPKFDRNQYSENADKIVIMPTWRPWEINTARIDFTETNYYKMIIRIFDSVPESLKENVIILPHPLIVNELNKIPSSLAEKIALNVRYDDILAETAVLITDYSSIAYDAFYRGARVIFYWEEKDFCMEQYGPTTKLMLNDENVYGDVFYNCDGLSEAIENNYYNKQTKEYLKKYSKLVDFHDGKNTERLINFLKDDEII